MHKNVGTTLDYNFHCQLVNWWRGKNVIIFGVDNIPFVHADNEK